MMVQKNASKEISWSKSVPNPTCCMLE